MWVLYAHSRCSFVNGRCGIWSYWQAYPSWCLIHLVLLAYMSMCNCRATSLSFFGIYGCWLGCIGCFTWTFAFLIMICARFCCQATDFEWIITHWLYEYQHACVPTAASWNSRHVKPVTNRVVGTKWLYWGPGGITNFDKGYQIMIRIAWKFCKALHPYWFSCCIMRSSGPVEFPLCKRPAGCQRLCNGDWGGVWEASLGFGLGQI